MLSYSNKVKPLQIDSINKGSSIKQNCSINTPESKKICFRPSYLQVPKKNVCYQSDVIIAPKTARSSYNANNLNSSFSRSTHITPDKQKTKKQLSFVQTKAQGLQKRQQNEYLKDKIDKTTKQIELRLVNNDRSQKILKNFLFKEISNCSQSQSVKLRQTVSNANTWLSKNHFPPKPIKQVIQFDSEPSQENKSTRMKIKSQFTPKKQEEVNPVKFIPRNHIRNNTTIQDNITKYPNLKINKQQSQNVTPRISQEKLTKSVRIQPNNPMSQTDPNGNFCKKIKINDLRSTMIVKQKYSGLQLQDFELAPCKGEGRFGKVFPAKHKKTGFLLAIKQIKKESVKLMMEQFIQELKISLFSNHSNLVRMYGFFHDNLNFYILMEYMEEGSLYKVIKLSKKMQQEQVITKLVEICQAVSYLHSLDILHRDIKPQNIVLSNGVCKLCDFGWATYSKQRRSTYCGTLDYVCPEILEGESYDNFVDIWAIGVLAYQMLTGKAPFYHISRQETMKSIMKCNFIFPEQMSSAAKSFITKSLQKTPDKRLTIEQLLKDKFLSQNIAKN